MQRIMMKSKLHQARITETLIDYEGSIAIDHNLMDLANIVSNEQAHIYDINNGERFITYVIAAKRGSKTISINGAAARLVQRNDRIIIVTYGIMDESELKGFHPKVIILDENNSAVT